MGLQVLKFAKIGYFSEFIFFLSYFPIRLRVTSKTKVQTHRDVTPNFLIASENSDAVRRSKISKGTTKGKRDCDLPLSFGNLSPSNACFCYHSGQSAASQTCSAPLAAIEFKRCCGSNSAVFYVRKTASLLMRACFGVPFRLTTGFLSSFWSVFLLSFPKERKKDAKK